MNHFLRMVDFKSAQNVDQFIANSGEVKKRIEKFYRREAVVIYPPAVSRIKNEELRIKNGEKDYYLCGGRLARAKGIDVIVKAFIKNGLPLKIFGRGFAGFEKELKTKVKRQKTNIELLGEVTDEEKLELMKGAKAYVFASYDEDFGITPVESMGVGIPVIAYKSGGVKETVIDGVTGLFFNENTPDELNKALNKFKKAKFDKEKIIEHAQKFSKESFIKKIKKVV